jgi:hypothetical protein
MSATPSRPSPTFQLILHRHRTRMLTATVIAALALLVGAQAASADNLLLLDTEQAVVSGDLHYALVYVDGELRLTGDTSITASSIYFGPHAIIHTCDVEGSGAGTGTTACTTGRSLTLSSPGQITLSGGIDLTAGAGTVRTAGSLNVSGGSVAIGGDVNTSGSGNGSSGSVAMSSSGGLSVGGINAPGASVGLTAAGPIDVGGDVQTQGTANQPQNDPSRAQGAGQVSIGSGGGDVRINGNINASGRDAPANGGAGLLGGNGASVAITGSDVRVGAIDSTGGVSGDTSSGFAAPIILSARGALSVLGRLDAEGTSSAHFGATQGERITATAGGPLVLSGGAFANGAQGTGGGTPGGTITVQGQSVDSGPLSVAGGDAPSAGTPTNGGNGGGVNVAATAHVSMGSVDATGGSAPALAAPAPGGAISVGSATSSIATGRLETEGGATGGGNGTDGGAIALSAQTNLSVGSVVDASGSNAAGNANPPRAGGNAGNILLRAATGTLALGGPVRALGGTGGGNSVAGATGGPGGHGGRVDVVAHALGSIVSISGDGGDGGNFGDTQGVGGAGGPIFAWTDAPLFDDQKVVQSDGGAGHPVGPSGARVTEMSPTGVTIDPATEKLSFTSRSPDASAYQVVRSIFGGAPTVLPPTGQTSGIATNLQTCVLTLFSVVAVAPGVGWVSDPAPTLAYLKPPSKTQTCIQAPALKASKKALKFSLKKLRHVHFKVTVKATSSGIGTIAASLIGKVKKGHHTTTKTLTKFTLKLTKAGSAHINLTLPLAARKPGTYSLKLVSTAPDGTHHTTTTLKLVVTK